jgi:Flp pilus assembly secretin CpaC
MKRSSRRAYVIGNEVGQTNVFFFDAEGKQMAGLDIAVTRDLNGIRAAIKQVLPDSDVRVVGIGDSSSVEVRGPEAFDLLQAMNTGHDGSMGTLHANMRREALSRLESMITMGGYALPSRTIREMIVGSIDVVIQAARLRDGSRRSSELDGRAPEAARRHSTRAPGKAARRYCRSA